MLTKYYVTLFEFNRAVGDFNYKFCSPNYAMKHKTSQPFLLHKHSVISCDIAKGGALRERRNVRTSGGSISILGNGIAYNVPNV